MHDERLRSPARRRFIGGAAITLAAARLGLSAPAEARQRASRHLAGLGRASTWVNSPPLTADSLAGKVVLVQFGTYTCINWLRTLPFVRAWKAKYPALVSIGVHTPEFGFEKDLENVRTVLRQLAVEFPIAVDNDYAIWRTFNNQYWPALYFIDARGRVRGEHFGEGEYERSERRIRDLLGEAGALADSRDVAPVAATGLELQADWQSLRSPETYLGAQRTERFSSPGGAAPRRRRSYRVPGRLALNEWALAGEWTMEDELTRLHTAQGRIEFRFHARDVHLVMGRSADGPPVSFRTSLDSRSPGRARGLDVDESGVGRVVEPRLYQLIRQPGPIVDRTIQIEFAEPGVEVFAFTFG